MQLSAAWSRRKLTLTHMKSLIAHATFMAAAMYGGPFTAVTCFYNEHASATPAAGLDAMHAAPPALIPIVVDIHDGWTYIWHPEVRASLTCNPWFYWC